MSEPTVAYSGYVNRRDPCPACGVPMMYRVDMDRDETTIVEAFCGRSDCPQFLLEVRVA